MSTSIVATESRGGVVRRPIDGAAVRARLRAVAETHGIALTSLASDSHPPQSPLPFPVPLPAPSDDDWADVHPGISILAESMPDVVDVDAFVRSLASRPDARGPLCVLNAVRSTFSTLAASVRRDLVRVFGFVFALDLSRLTPDVCTMIADVLTVVPDSRATIAFCRTAAFVIAAGDDHDYDNGTRAIRALRGLCEQVSVQTRSFLEDVAFLLTPHRPTPAYAAVPDATQHVRTLLEVLETMSTRTFVEEERARRTEDVMRRTAVAARVVRHLHDPLHALLWDRHAETLRRLVEDRDASDLCGDA